MSEQKQKFYLTTPIYYVNARPHIGHAYTTIVADVLARRHRLLGDDTFFLTGTDEHGQKIERSALAAGVPPQQFADQVSAEFEKLWTRMGITHNTYIRTTDEKHKKGVQKLFSKLYENGFIELRAYTGTYCVSDEAFVDVPVGAPCPDCGRITEEITEENFFFKLSEFQKPLLDLIECGPNGEEPVLKIENEARRNEVLSFLLGSYRKMLEECKADPRCPDLEGLTPREAYPVMEKLGIAGMTAAGNIFHMGALKDLSVSRSSFTWGIPVPEPAASEAKDKHVIYVWLDALANYMTAIGYGSDKPADEEQFKKYWPADLHLVGKEIIRFHCVYWPAFLLALNPVFQQTAFKYRHSVTSANKPRILPDPAQLSPAEHTAWAKQMLPKAITAHGWLLFDNSKMSKSKGNIVRTETILDGFGDHVYGKQFPDSTKAERDLFAADVLRYFLLREIPFGQDGSFSFDAVWQRYNSDLTNGYGNLVNRTLTMVRNYFDGVIPDPSEFHKPIAEGEAVGLRFISSTIVASALDYAIRVQDRFGISDFSGALAEIWKFLNLVDQYISTNTPWAPGTGSSAGDAHERAEVLYTASEAIRIITALIYPILPNAALKGWKQLGLGDIASSITIGKLSPEWGGLAPGTKLGLLAPIFPRADKGLTQIMTDMENPTPEAESIPNQPEASLAAAATPAHAQPVTDDPTHPAAPPRTSAIEDPSAGTHVGGSAAITTERPATPSHSEAPASGAFATVASQASINAGPADASPQITIDDFAKIELRVAEIKVAERIPKADKLLRLEVDLGYEKRQILSGIAEWYTPEELIGRRIVVITNLAPRKMRGLESHGMLLAASHGEGGKPVLATFGEDIALGSRLK